MRHHGWKKKLRSIATDANIFNVVTLEYFAVELISQMLCAIILCEKNLTHMILAILRPFLVIFSQAKFISFTKLRFRWSFWCAEQVWILIGTKAAIWITNCFNNYVFQFWKKKNPENSSFKNGHFRPYVIIFWKLHWYLLQNWDSDGNFEVQSV